MFEDFNPHNTKTPFMQKRCERICSVDSEAQWIPEQWSSVELGAGSFNRLQNHRGELQEDASLMGNWS